CHGTSSAHLALLQSAISFLIVTRSDDRNLDEVPACRERLVPAPKIGQWRDLGQRLSVQEPIDLTLRTRGQKLAAYAADDLMSFITPGDQRSDSTGQQHQQQDDSQQAGAATICRLDRHFR